MRSLQYRRDCPK
ncbi:UNVERIFIED_CONTAM: hypothetical protein GTU68_010195 [Idotea baltica]|nr:hypothetical protein [Idotea baltica]